jgi:putative transposase
MDTRYRVSAGVLYTLKYHFVWCPKYRKPVLVAEVEKRLRQLLYQKAKELDAEIHALEIMPDHVRMFVESDPRLAPAHLAAQFKGFTSHVLRRVVRHGNASLLGTSRQSAYDPRRFTSRAPNG